MKAGWVSKKLASVTTKIGSGATPLGGEEAYKEAGISLIRSLNVHDWGFKEAKLAHIDDLQASRLSNVVVEADDVLLNITGASVARCCLAPPDILPARVNQHVSIIRPVKEKLSSALLHYLLISKNYKDRLLQTGEDGGSTRQAITKAQIQEFIVDYPESLPEQQRIVGILDEAFDGIATAKANAEKNLQNARALFESGLNAAITGELSHEWRRARLNTVSASAHLTKKLTQRRSQWKGNGNYQEPDPPVGNKPFNIPITWTVASPEQISTHIVDCPHSTPKWTNSGVPCLRTTNFKAGFLDLESVQFVSEETYKERIMRLEPKPGDVLYSREGGILGIACIFPKNLRACLGQRMMQFRLDVNLALPEYFTGVLNSTSILSEVQRLTGGAAAPHLNIRDIRTFPIPLPPIAEQYHIVAKLDTVSAETQHLESIYQQKLAALEELKKSLLDQAFSGAL